MDSKNNNENNNANIKKAPKWFYLVLVLFPIIFIILLELSLIIFKYGEDFETFKPLSINFPNRLALNQNLTLKYFSNLNNYPTPLADSFLKIKTKNTYRVFVLGGSSAEGWPYAFTGSFAAFLKRRLDLLYPEKNIEVANFGISAINTYTIRDIVPDIIDQQPDLILFYGGHNEYYGALGVGSTVSMGNSRSLINLYISISHFRTVQLLNKVISKFFTLFNKSKNKKETGNRTLMERVIGNSKIVFHSEVFNKGVEQFEGNLEDILNYFKNAKIPIILGKLTSNLLDQKPFISINTKDFPGADSIYQQGLNEYNKGNYKYAHNLLLQAKELDALRFRAPEKFNNVISNLGEKYNIPVIDIDSLFSVSSPNGTVGYNLTVDHLHPNLTGYKLIARAFYDKMYQSKLLPDGHAYNIPEDVQDSLLDANFPFTKFDSTIAQLKLNILTGSYPFVPSGSPNYKMIDYRPKDYSDSLALQFVKKEIFWQRAHVYLADRYFQEKKYNNFEKEIKSLIALLPFDDTPYEYAAKRLIEAQLFNNTLPYLIKLEKINPSYYSKKWIGTINLQNEKYIIALKYLEEASHYTDADFQLWYNLSGAYYYNKQYKNAIDAIQNSLKLNANNQSAKLYYNQLKTFLEKLKK